MTIGGLAGARPASIKVFQRFGIDFCCGGRKSLAEACAAKGIDPANVLKEISREEDACAVDDRGGWASRSTEELLSLLVRHYHPRLRDDLVRLQGLAVKVLRVHGSKDPERLHALATAIVDLQEELEPHLDKEEQVLFPMILTGQGPSARQADRGDEQRPRRDRRAARAGAHAHRELRRPEAGLRDLAGALGGAASSSTSSSRSTSTSRTTSSSLAPSRGPE